MCRTWDRNFESLLPREFRIDLLYLDVARAVDVVDEFVAQIAPHEFAVNDFEPSLSNSHNIDVVFASEKLETVVEWIELGMARGGISVHFEQQFVWNCFKAAH